jgi:hypothetical protein
VSTLAGHRHLLLYNNSAFFAAKAAKNRAFRFKSSEAPMRFLWAFRCNAPEGRSLSDKYGL